MDTYLLDWLHELLRYGHIATAMIWIGASFFFVWLDNSLVPADGEGDRDLGVSGSLWALYGGAFYNMRKFPLGPRRGAVSHLHWLYWESYATWLSGMALLLGPLYVAHAGWAAWGFILVGWLGYEVLCWACRSFSGRYVAWWVALGVLLADRLACQWFPGQVAFLLVGTMLGTIMTANIFFRVIPGQRASVAHMLAGHLPPSHGVQRGKVRSLHNTYLALPVLVTMLSHHNPMLSERSGNWVVLAVLMLMAVLVRHFFVERHKGRLRWELWMWVGGLGTAVVAWLAP
ncbi:urate hydroxylase PuuD [Leptothrix ochracea]|uniref:urate hydroxylase PuuD n=1 Tax=Leptothrix ochracea TaxID=735331 RepID=UPI0034E2F133